MNTVRGTKRKFEDIAEDNTGENHAIDSGAGETNQQIKPCTNNVDKLEEYLENIYSKYCRFSISKKEIEFIQNGVEKLTHEYVEKTYRCSPCNDLSCKIKNCGELELVRAGSFYEGTRNTFPDEFDFIAVLGSVNEEPDGNTIKHLKIGFCTRCEEYRSDEFPGYTMQFKFTNGSRSHGKATHLEFIYKRDDEEITIDVDIVIALRCYKLKNFFTVEDIFNKNFYYEMVKTGSFLFVHGGSSSEVVKTPDGTKTHTNINGPWDKSVTETETRFVRDTLSRAHKKMYRILKYIINGPFGENLFRYMDEDWDSPLFMMCGPSFHISSYVIKIAVIHHHYACTHLGYTPHPVKIGDCVIHILNYIIAAYDQTSYQTISMHSLLYRNKVGPNIGSGSYHFLGNFYWCLLAFTERLKSLKSSDDEIVKCTHDLEDSFLEMALRLDIFADYEAKLIRMESILSNKSILWPFNINLKTLVKKVKEYTERRKRVLECPWCDYPIFIMAQTRKL